MSFSEDSTTPAAPFSGDGSVFDEPDVLLASPVTTERVVDTQSGFLLVIRRMGQRLALTCKRRIGTPPNSVILLTPDESLKLSKVLAASMAGMTDSGEVAKSSFVLPGKRRLPFSVQSPRSAGMLQQLAKPMLAIFGLAIVGCAFMLGMGIHKAPLKAAQVVAAVPAVADPLSKASVDKFAHAFVSQMLDFSAETYRVSQVRVMAVMAPDLMKKYWKETSFPVTPAQLKLLPQSSVVVIDHIDQKRTSQDTATADVYAQLVRSDAKLGSAVHVKLKLALDEDGAIRVVGQEDMTADAK